MISLKSELSIIRMLSISCIECDLSLPQAQNFECFCMFICYRFRGLNQFEEGRIVTKYLFRIVCSVRVCTENINQSALFCFLLFAFVCQSSFSFSYSFLFLHSFSSIHFNLNHVC